MEINIQEILNKHYRKTYGRGLNKNNRLNKLFNSAIKEIITEVLKEAADSAKVEHIKILKTEGNKITETKSIRVGSVIDDYATLWVPHKESITSTINKVKF